MFPAGLNKFWQRISKTLYQTDANTVEQYNSTTPQALRIYNTRTDAGNYERGVVSWAGNTFEVGAENSGTGVGRDTKLTAGNNASVLIETRNSIGTKTVLASFNGYNAISTFHATHGIAFPASGAVGLPNLRIKPKDGNGLHFTFGGGVVLCDLTIRNLIGTGSLATGIANKTANYTSTLNDGTLTFDASGGALTCTLETAVGANGRIHAIVKIDSSANTVTIDPNAAETINGAATLVLSAQWDKAILQSDGANWIRIA